MFEFQCEVFTVCVDVGSRGCARHFFFSHCFDRQGQRNTDNSFFTYWTNKLVYVFSETLGHFCLIYRCLSLLSTPSPQGSWLNCVSLETTYRMTVGNTVNPTVQTTLQEIMKGEKRGNLSATEKLDGNPVFWQNCVWPLVWVWMAFHPIPCLARNLNKRIFPESRLFQDDCNFGSFGNKKTDLKSSVFQSACLLILDLLS